MGVVVSVNAALPPPLYLCIKAFQENGWSVRHVFYKNFLDVKMGFTKTCSKTDDYGEGETQIIIENKFMILSHHDVEHHH